LIAKTNRHDCDEKIVMITGQGEVGIRTWKSHDRKIEITA
jgi:hypothetical protein